MQRPAHALSRNVQRGESHYGTQLPGAPTVPEISIVPVLVDESEPSVRLNTPGPN